MYSNYSYQQQQGQQTHEQNGHVWNGATWVPQQQPVAPTTYASAVQNYQVIRHGQTHSQLVQHYTTHYHGWNAQVTEAQTNLSGLPPPHPMTPQNNEKRTEWEAKQKWAQYYASSCAALAHYHLSMSKGEREPYTRPKSPPPPPSVQKQQKQQQQQQQADKAAAAASKTAKSTVKLELKKAESSKVQKTAKPAKDDANIGKLRTSSSAASDGGLYSKFVQEGSRDHSSSTAATKKLTGKRKQPSALGSDSYYGPVATGDYIPLGLDQPLGGKKKKKKKVSSGGEINQGFNTSEKKLNSRAARFQGKGDGSNVSSTIRNVEKYMGKTTIGGTKKQLSDVDYERMTVKGTCTNLEKEYLRLTSPPKASLVRPQPILEKHLRNIQESYYKGNKVHAGRQRDYLWYCSQLKAMRQDLTVQRIQNSFIVKVYETHAKIALLEDDTNEYNQSQTQLRELYDLMERRVGSGKEVKDAKLALKNRDEFIAYLIIYYVFLSGNEKYDGGSSDIFKIMLGLTKEQRENNCIRHALQVRAAVAGSDYHKFFKLQDVAPNLSDLLMDKIVPGIRIGALQRIVKSYRPSVASSFVLKELGFDTEDKSDVANGLAWMKSCGCKFDGENLVSKDTVLKDSGSGVKNRLI